MLSLIYYKGCFKGTREETEEEMHRVRSRRVLRAASSAPVELGCAVLCIDVFMNLETTNPILLKFLWRLQHAGIVDH